MKKNTKRTTKITNSSVYFDIIASIGIGRKSIVELSKLLNKSSPAVFEQVKKLLNEKYLIRFKEIGETKLSGDEKKYFLNVLKLNEDIYEYFLKKDESIKKYKEELISDFISVIDMLSLSSFLVGKDYTLEKLFEKYFSSNFVENIENSYDVLYDLRNAYWYKLYKIRSKILDKDNDWKVAIDKYKNIDEKNRRKIRKMEIIYKEKQNEKYLIRYK